MTFVWLDLFKIKDYQNSTPKGILGPQKEDKILQLLSELFSRYLT